MACLLGAGDTKMNGEYPWLQEIYNLVRKKKISFKIYFYMARFILGRDRRNIQNIGSPEIKNGRKSYTAY